MSDVIKKVAACLAIMFSLGTSVGLLHADETFVAGTVREFSYKVITVDDETYKVDPKVRVLLHERRGAAIMERRGLRSDVQVGSTVTLKLMSGVATLIYVELYH
jgi:hypothetical protein